ncbi:hypothetical protein [Actinocorallia longicatena]|uniref:Uncharacterized protein n=1 Tax=Actinocorallia longicatena TaxID=111803 RepID=A0ABP6Q7E4_9ACTN
MANPRRRDRESLIGPVLAEAAARLSALTPVPPPAAVPDPRQEPEPTGRT